MVIDMQNLSSRLPVGSPFQPGSAPIVSFHCNLCLRRVRAAQLLIGKSLDPDALATTLERRRATGRTT